MPGRLSPFFALMLAACSTSSSAASDAGGESGPPLTGGPCASQCMTSVCAQPSLAPRPFDPCDNCLSAELNGPDAGCQGPVVTACRADPDCVALESTCLGVVCDRDDAGMTPTAMEQACATFDGGGPTNCSNCCFDLHREGGATLNDAILKCVCTGM